MPTGDAANEVLPVPGHARPQIPALDRDALHLAVAGDEGVLQLRPATVHQPHRLLL